MVFTTFLQKIAPIAGISEEELQLLSTPEHIRKAELEVAGKKYPAFRVQFNSARGPYKGGIRFHPEVNQEEVTDLAFWMTLKTAVADLPLGGGKGGVTCNPKEMSTWKLEELSREFIRAFHKYIGPKKDIPAPDVYTTPQIMAWMRDEYEKITGKSAPGVITGKPLDYGGSKVRDIATALGGVYILEEAANKLGLTDKRVVIQGFGNAGMNATKLLAEKGFQIIAISDSKGGIFSADGLNVEEVIRVKEETKSVINYQNAEKISNEQLLELDCGILVPSALADVLTAQNAANIKAKIVLELANGPTTSEADDILHQNKVLVLPDILANAGGVTVSCFEWQQNIAGESWDEEVIKQKLRDKLVQAFAAIWVDYSSTGHSFRTATYIHALKKVLDAEKVRGRL